MQTDLTTPGDDAKAIAEARDIARHSRIGLLLFFIYLVIYAAFVIVTAFSPSTMSKPAFGGMNLAVAYGFGLIIAAMALAFLYTWLCRKR